MSANPKEICENLLLWSFLPKTINALNTSDSIKRATQLHFLYLLFSNIGLKRRDIGINSPCYRPQTGNVMFSLACVSHSVHGGRRSLFGGGALSGVSVQEVSVQGFSIQGVSVQGVSVQGFSIQGVSVQEVSCKVLHFNIQPN